MSTVGFDAAAGVHARSKWFDRDRNYFVPRGGPSRSEGSVT